MERTLYVGSPRLTGSEVRYTVFGYRMDKHKLRLGTLTSKKAQTYVCMFLGMNSFILFHFQDELPSFGDHLRVCNGVSWGVCIRLI